MTPEELEQSRDLHERRLKFLDDKLARTRRGPRRRTRHGRRGGRHPRPRDARPQGARAHRAARRAAPAGLDPARHARSRPRREGQRAGRRRVRAGRGEDRLAHDGGLVGGGRDRCVPREERIPALHARSAQRAARPAHRDEPVGTGARASRRHRGDHRAHAIQVELVGNAADTPNWDAGDYARIARLAREIEAAVGVPRRALATFDGAGRRLGPGAWLRGAGHCGHCHVPGNDHTDPGRFLIERVI